MLPGYPMVGNAVQLGNFYVLCNGIRWFATPCSWAIFESENAIQYLGAFTCAATNASSRTFVGIKNGKGCRGTRNDICVSSATLHRARKKNRARVPYRTKQHKDASKSLAWTRRQLCDYWNRALVIMSCTQRDKYSFPNSTTPHSKYIYICIYIYVLMLHLCCQYFHTYVCTLITYGFL